MKFRKYVRITSIFAILIALPLVYQNCTQFGTSTYRGEEGFSSYGSLAFNPTLYWDLAHDQDVEVNRLSQVQRWVDRTGKSVVLFPPLSSPNVVNMDRAPMVTQTATGSLILFGPSQALGIQGGDSLSMVASQYTASLYVRDVNNIGPGLRLFTLSPSDNSSTGYLVIDIYEVPNAKILVRAFEYYDNNTYGYADVELPNTALSGGLSVVARFSEDPAQMRLAVNGIEGGALAVGSPSKLGNLARVLSLHGPDHFTGGFSLAGLAVWKEELTNSQMVSLSQSFRTYYESGGTSTIGYEENSGSGGSSGTLTFSKIRSSFNTCINCHDQFSSRSALMSTGWVVAGNSAQSQLIKALRHQAGADPMPRNQGALPESTIQQIENWINQGAQ